MAVAATVEREVDASANPRRVESSRSDGWNGGESERTSKQGRRKGGEGGGERTKERKAGARIHRAGKSRGSYVKRGGVERSTLREREKGLYRD